MRPEKLFRFLLAIACFTGSWAANGRAQTGPTMMGRITDANGHPISGATIVGTCTQDKLTAGGSATTQSDAHGYYGWLGADGNCSLRFSAPGYQTVTLEDRHFALQCCLNIEKNVVLGAIALTNHSAGSRVTVANPIAAASSHQPTEYGVIVWGGNGVTDNRSGFHFLAAGVHAGRVLTNNFGPGLLNGNFEYAVEVLPYWEAITPHFQRVSIRQVPGSSAYIVSQPYTVGGNYHGASVTPIILRWNFAAKGKLVPWVQAAGGILWTNHKFPAYGNLDPLNYTENGPNGETSVWNFTPQGGIGVHYFIKPNRSIDFSANGEHISSASLGDRNPGVNASVQFSVGYTWWK